MKKLGQPLILNLFVFCFLLVPFALLQGCASSSTGNPDPTPLAISTTSLPSGQVGTAYSATLVATGGKSPFMWSLTSGTLPANLQLNAATGAITGTPTVTVTNTALTFQVKDSSSPQQSKSVNLTLTIAAPTLAISTTSLPSGQVGVAYSQTLVATGGTTPYSWTLSSGALPANLQLNAATGAITGTPTVTVTNTALTFQVKDSSSPQQTKSVNLTLTIAAPTLAISTTSLPSGQVGVAYSQTLVATGGTTPYNWTLTSGALPANLQVNAATGAITGTPTISVSNTPLTFQVKDSSSPQQSKSVNLTLTIAATTLAISTTSLPSGQVGVAYSQTLVATGGTTPYNWTLTSGALPANLQLNAATGAITGTPTVTVTNTALTFQVKDSSNPQQSKSVNLTLTIAPATVAISTTSLPSGQVGVAYSQTLVATGGTTPYNWTLTSGALPANLQLNGATGAITGTPTVTVTNTALTFQVKDSSSPQQSKSVNLTLTIVAPTLAISTTSMPNGQVGAAYSTTLGASGGTTPYNWTLTSGALPANLQLNAATGTITGTPTVTVTNTPLTFQVKDSSSPQQSKSVNLTLTIAPATVAISTTSLPSGQVGVAYSQSLVATGGTTPYNWTLTSGALPANLQLNAATGAITGTPTATVTNTALTFQVKDSSSPQQSKSVNLTLTIAAPTLAISTTSLPSGQVGVAYSQTLVATGGTTPYNWTLTSGALPANLQLNAATGAITGTPAVSVTNTPLTFQVSDAGSPQQSKTVNLSLTIIPAAGITVSLSPKRGGLTVTQSLPLTATTNDPQGVTWTASAGTFSASNATTATYVAPGSAGTVTVTATSATDGVTSASATIGVTNLAGVLTYHNDLARDGVNAQEYALTTANVTTATFGKLFSCAIDAPAYAQPLWVPNLNIGGGKHNVVFAATSHNSVYAFDADAKPCATYWTVSLMNTGETFLSNGDVGTTDIFPDIGIVGTPVIDAASSTLYVVSKSKTNGTSCTPDASCFQRLHALSLIDGSEKFGGPANITSAISVPGTGDGSSGGNVPFNTLRENQRPGLVLLNGVVYVAWASHGDNTPYHGWVIGFDKTSLSRVATFNANPNGSDAGIWMSGGAPAADPTGNLYFLTGNGTFDANTGGSDYGDSTVKLSTSGGLSVADYFTPKDQASLSINDTDHGSGGAAILMDPSSGPVAHLLIGGGKSGVLYLLNRDNMGGFNSSTNNVVQSLVVSGNEILATAAIWNNSLYIAASSSPMQQFPFNLATGQFGSASHSSSHSFGGKGATPSVSASSASANGIVWALDSGAYGTPCCANGPAVLHAYDAANVGTELWNSTQGTGNAAGNAVKFTVPTVANGKVYVGTRSELSVYGLLP